MSEQLGTCALSLSGECHWGPHDMEEGVSFRLCCSKCAVLQRGLQALVIHEGQKTCQNSPLGTSPERVNLGPGLHSQYRTQRVPPEPALCTRTPACLAFVQ